MGDTKEIKIVLETRDGGSASSGEEGARADQSVAAQNSASSSKSSGSKSSGTAAAVALGSMAAQTVLSEVSSWAMYYVNKELVLNDDYIGQRELGIAMQAVNWGINSASTIASMTATGAMAGGAVGAVFGAVIGTGTVIARTVRDNIQAQDQQNIRLRQLQVQLDYTRNRAGWSTNAASIGEDL